MPDISIINETRAHLREMGKTRGPVLVGPWLGEIGFELLYWLPWLRWACRLAGFRREDVHVISRGGCRSWYQDIGAQYVDVLDFFSPEAFKAANEQRMATQASHAASLGLKSRSHSPKQHEVSAFDRNVLALACTALELPQQTRVLHPSMMYRYFKPYWRRQDRDLFDRSSIVSKLTAPNAEQLARGSYVAMKFYASAAMPATPENRDTVQQIVHEQAKLCDVVLLHSATRYDDHAAFSVDAQPRVHQLPMPPATNLDIQTEVIAKASRFVGTYGGFAYLAPFLGVEALALYDVANFRKDHRLLMERLCDAPLGVRFQVETLARGRNMIQRRGDGRAA